MTNSLDRFARVTISAGFTTSTRTLVEPVTVDIEIDGDELSQLAIKAVRNATHRSRSGPARARVVGAKPIWKRRADLVCEQLRKDSI